MILWILLGIIVILFYIGYDYKRKIYTGYWTVWWAKQVFYVIKTFFICVITGIKLVFRWLGLYKGENKR